MIFQITWDCASPSRMTQFWSQALGYLVEDPPSGFETWNDYWLSIGVSPDELDPDGGGSDSLVDPDGTSPRIRFQVVPEGKSVKNRLHLDISASGGRSVEMEVRKRRVQARAEELITCGARRLRVLEQEGLDHYAEVMADPEDNEFCIN
jgi:hypothetical protein